jgi:glycosyltransferase involved in cell wall biosynthesis
MSDSEVTWSILLPTHDGRATLEVAVASALAQSDGDFELLVVGDGCTDDTARYMASLSDPRVRFFDLPKAPGFGYANRNVALRQARGIRIAYLAHDDLWAPDHLAQLGAALDTGADLAYSRPLWITPDGILTPLPVDLGDPAQLESFLSDFNEIPAVCIAVTRSSLEAAGGWPEDVESAGDWELWKRILRSSEHGPAMVPAPTTIHFRARWRTSDTRSVERLQALAERPGDWWPEVLRTAVADGDPAMQTALYDVIVRNAEEWWGDLRTGARQLDARLQELGLDVPDLEHRLFATEDIVTEVRSRNGELDDSITALANDLAAAQKYITRLELELGDARDYIDHANEIIREKRWPLA